MHKDAILYIDDDLSSIKIMEHVFKNKFTLFTLENTQEAISVLKLNEIKVVICDQQMPEDTGLEFFKRIKPDFPDISLIILTGHADMHLALETINSGIIHRFLTKPWKKNELELAIINGIESFNLKKENKFLIESLKSKNADLEEYTTKLINTTNALAESKDEIKIRENAIKEIIEASYSMGEAYFFVNMVLSLNRILKADFTFIGTLIPNNKLKTTAFCKNNEVVDNIEYNLIGSPCENVIANESIVIKNNVVSKFPKYKLFEQAGIKGYLGTPIFSLSGIPIGILVSLYKTPIIDASFGQTLFELFATNIGSEIERRSIVKDLKESQLKLSNIFGSINDAIMVHPFLEHGFGNFIEVNQIACERYGYTKAEFLKLSPLDITFAHDVNIHAKTDFRKKIKMEQRVTFETIHITKEGKKFPVEIISNLVEFNEGLMILATVRDITDRIKAENELRESEAKFKQFFNKSTDAIFVAETRSGKIIDANDTACRKLEMDKAQIIGLHQSDLHPKHFGAKSKEMFKLHVDDVIKGEAVKSLESLLLTSSNKEIPVEVSANLVTLNGVPHILGIFRDISLRKEAESKLIQSENKYKTAFKTSPDAIIITSPEGELIDVNDGFTKHTGYSKEEAIGKKLLTLGLWKNLSDRERYLEQLNTNKKVTNFETSFIAKNGKELFALASAKPIILNNKQRILNIARDISDRIKMEQEVFENEQLLNKVFESAPYIVALLNENREVIRINLDSSNADNEVSVRRIGAVLKCVAFCRRGEKEPKYKFCVGCCIADQFRQTYETGKSVVKQETKVQECENSHTKLRYYLISTSLIKRKGKKYVLLTIDDITDQKNIQNELVASKEKAEYNEKRYSLLSDLTFEGIILHDKIKIIDVNKAMQKLSGYGKEDLIGANVLDLLFEDKYHDLIKKKLQNKYTAPYEIYLKRKNKTLVPVEVEANDFKLKNKTLRVAAIRNVTERKEAEKLVLQAIVSTEEKQKTKFAQELHDGLGPLLSNVQMYFQWLADEDENKEFVLEKGLVSLQNAFSSLREISNNLSPHILHDFGLTKAIKHFINDMPGADGQILSIASRINDKRYHIDIEVALYRILTELINNSKKYANAKNIIVNIEEKKDKIHLDYSDDGIGFNIEDESLLKSGKGLFNIKNRIRTLNGSFELNSDINKGVEVNIKVPILIN